MDDGSTAEVPPGSGDGRSVGNPAPNHLQALVSTPSTQLRRRGLARRAHEPHPLNLSADALRPYERVMDVSFLMPFGDWTRLPNALLSSDWTQSGIPAQLAEGLGHDIVPFPARRFWTPRGRVTCTRGVRIWVYLHGLPFLPLILFLPVFEAHELGSLGVSIILGKPFLDRCFGDGWPLLVPHTRHGQAAAGSTTTFRVTVLDVPQMWVPTENMPEEMDQFFANSPGTNLALPALPPTTPFMPPLPLSEVSIRTMEDIREWVNNSWLTADPSFHLEEQQ
ncbi:hypothetical protein N657DRAFT_26641 [Parathielavia appendiculata]|uniref:Uncharacterized protein n=1 Tax=Parathielavia appendiculata TaxID=2587402 RepID=A0AAN6U8Q1_9PEZI|nr:hypothetical protein N657DRAFT_26641 [Parathielavia appendiculata]